MISKNYDLLCPYRDKQNYFSSNFVQFEFRDDTVLSHNMTCSNAVIYTIGNDFLSTEIHRASLGSLKSKQTKF